MIIHTDKNNSVLTLSKIDLSQVSDLQKKIIKQSIEDDVEESYYEKIEERTFSRPLPVNECHSFLDSHSLRNKHHNYPSTAIGAARQYLDDVSKYSTYGDSFQSFDFINNNAYLLKHLRDDHGNFIDKYAIQTCEMKVPLITELFVDALTEENRAINLSRLFNNQLEFDKINWILNAFDNPANKTKKRRNIADWSEAFALFYYEIYPYIIDVKSYNIKQLQQIRNLATSCDVDTLLANIPLAEENAKILTLAKKR